MGILSEVTLRTSETWEADELWARVKGDTPADRVGIRVWGANKWLTLIQNRAYFQSVNREDSEDP